MPRVVVQLVSIVCHKTEDDTGADEIYLLAGAGSALEDLASGTTAPQVTVARYPKEIIIPPQPGTGDPVTYALPTHSMNNGDTWTVNDTILKAEVGFGPVEIGIWLFDQDTQNEISEKDLEKIRAIINASGQILAPITHGASELGSTAANFLLTLIVGALRLDSDDLLGFDHVKSTLMVPVPTLPHTSMQYNTPIPHSFRADMDGASYDVFYTITFLPQ